MGDCGCDSTAKPGETIQYDRALELIRGVARAQEAFGSEAVAVRDALGRVLAESVASRERLPRYDNSAVDGFAARAAELGALLTRGEARLRVVGRSVAGDEPPIDDPGEGVVWEIMTGAPFAPGFDCSLKVEDVDVRRDARGRALEISVPAGYAPPESGDGVRPAGEDFQPGQPVLARGELFEPRHLLAATALGIERLNVFKKPRVAVISTGGEVVDQSAVAPGQTRNSTAPFLAAELASLGCIVTLAKVADDPREFCAALEKALADAPDLILTTGGVSMGIYDHVPSVAADLGAEALFHRVAIRPGKPILFARFKQGPVLFGLPGNPLSTVVGVRFFVEPYLRTRCAQNAEAPLTATLSAPARKPNGLRCFFKARLALVNGRVDVTVLRGQASFMISPLLEANAWAVLPEDGDSVARETDVDVYPLRSNGVLFS